jgi:hypothetical protein
MCIFLSAAKSLQCVTPAGTTTLTSKMLAAAAAARAQAQ